MLADFTEAGSLVACSRNKFAITDGPVVVISCAASDAAISACWVLATAAMRQQAVEHSTSSEICLLRAVIIIILIVCVSRL